MNTTPNTLNRPVRTRFAPSPTGYLHVGGVRTTIFAWLFAKHHNGKFLLRIEDTDRDRLVADSVLKILRDLAWMGIEIDEGPSPAELKAGGYETAGFSAPEGAHGPYIQSLRRARYAEVAEQLIATGEAYRCDCTAEDLEKERNEQTARGIPPGYAGRCRNRNVPKENKHVVRLKIPQDRSFTLHDLVRGDIVWERPTLRDTVLLKSDGFPTYHLAVVVDDHDMEISHVFRGDEWLATTPIHLRIYEVLGWEPPAFCHVPPVLGHDGKKLSKRHGAADVESYRQSGYLPEALLNYLLMIGWAPGSGDEQEIFTREEMIAKFSASGISSGGGSFAETKLKWMNGLYMRRLPPEEFLKRAKPFLKHPESLPPLDRLMPLIPHVQERVETLCDAELQLGFFSDETTFDVASLKSRKISLATARTVTERCIEALKSIPSFTLDELTKLTESLVAEDAPKKSVFQTLRIAVTGQEGTPPLIDCMLALGPEHLNRRLGDALKAIEAAEQS